MSNVFSQAGVDVPRQHTVEEIQTSDYEANRRIELASKYLTSESGSHLKLTDREYEEVKSLVLDSGNAGSITNADLAALNAAGFEELRSEVRENTLAVQQEVRAIGNLVVSCHADTVNKMNVLQDSIERVNDNVCVLGNNVSIVAEALTQLRRDFQSYIEQDARSNNVQQAETKLVQINQELESSFGHNKTLRRTAVGILQAADMQAIRPETVLTSAEELCVQTPNYWLAPALVALAKWVQVSQGSLAREELGADSQVIINMLNEAYRRERAKTALFFGLICRRANNLRRAHEWFMEYLSFQQPEVVDHTCTVLLNVYANGLMGHGAEEQETAEVFASWRDKLMADPEGRYAAAVLNDWKGTCYELYSKAQPTTTTFSALESFCPEAYPYMMRTLQASSLHREMHAFMEREMLRKDFEMQDSEAIDRLLFDLVSAYDADELPLRREEEYQKLVVDLGGDVRLAQALRGIKDDVLSETKSFMSILSDAARAPELTSATAATRVLALKMQMPWIRQAYEQATAEYRTAIPGTIPIHIGDFTASTADGSNEEEVVKEFVSFVNGQERAGLEASMTGTKERVALIGGAVVALLGLILTFAVSAVFALFTLLGIVAAFYGYNAGRKARQKQEEIEQAMKKKRTSGTLAIRKTMQEIRTWRNELAQNERSFAGNVSDMSEYIIDPTDIR